MSTAGNIARRIRSRGAFTVQAACINRRSHHGVCRPLKARVYSRKLAIVLGEMLMIETPDAAANGIIKKYAALSAGAGLIPIAGLDFVAIAGVELKMLADLARLYRVPFSHDRVKG